MPQLASHSATDHLENKSLRGWCKRWAFEERRDEGPRKLLEGNVGEIEEQEGVNGS